MSNKMHKAPITFALVLALLGLAVAASQAKSSSSPTAKQTTHVVHATRTHAGSFAKARSTPIASDRDSELLHRLSTTEASATESIPMPSLRTISMEVTAYCPCSKCCGPQAAGITASGKTVDYNGGRFVAADTSNLPFGTQLLIPGYSSEDAPVEVIDRGGAIKGNRLDVFFATHQEALEWGRRHVEVVVME